VNTYPTPDFQAAPSRGGPLRSWVAFWFTPADPLALHAVRVAAGLLFLAWLLPFAGQAEALFGLQGWVDARAYRELAQLPDGLPGSSAWSLLYLGGADPAWLNAAYWLGLASVALFTLGVCTRLTSVLTWLTVASFTANPALRYGPDGLLAMLAFYLMLGYVFLGQWGRRQSLLGRLFGETHWPFGRRAAEDEADAVPPSVAANLALRLVQVHLAVLVCVGGLHKLQVGEWWAGVAFWYPLHPPLEVTFADVRSHAASAVPYLFALSLAGYAVLAWQIAFPAFAWRKGWRAVLLAGAALGWAGALLLYRQPLAGKRERIGS
jgi:hypothetical protein